MLQHPYQNAKEMATDYLVLFCTLLNSYLITLNFCQSHKFANFFPREGDLHLTKWTKIFAVTSCDSSCGQEYRQWPSLRALVNCYAFFLCSPREIRAEKDKQRTIRTGRNKFNTNPKDVSPLGWTLLGGGSSKWYLSWISTRIKIPAVLAVTDLASDWLATHLEPCILYTTGLVLGAT